MIKKTFFVALLVISSLIFGGCGQNQPTLNNDIVEENIVTKAGKITLKSGDEYLFQTSDGIVNITSNKFDLDTYLNKNIEISGMFSGTTLYVDTLVEK